MHYYMIPLSTALLSSILSLLQHEIHKEKHFFWLGSPWGTRTGVLCLQEFYNVRQILISYQPRHQPREEIIYEAKSRHHRLREYTSNTITYTGDPQKYQRRRVCAGADNSQGRISTRERGGLWSLLQSH